MNDLNTNTRDRDELLQEGIIDDALKSTAGVNLSDVKAGWKDADNAVDKLNSLNTNAISPAADSLGKISSTLGKYTLDTRSIISRAKNSVVQFPMYVTQTTRVNEARIIAGMFERVYATFVQTVLSHNQIISEDEANDLAFLKRFHTNLREAADVLVNTYYRPIDELDQMMCEGIFYSQQLTENCRVDFSVIPCTDQDIILENARLMNEPLSGFTYLREGNSSTESDTTKGTSRFTTLSDSDLEDMAAERSNISAEDKRLARSGSEDNDRYNQVRKELDDAVAQLKEDIKNNEVKGCAFKGGRYVRTDKTSEETHTSTTNSEFNSRAVDAPKFLRDADINKINSLTPYTIEATFRVKTEQGYERDVKYVIGIKSVMHLIRPQDLADDLQELITGNIKSLQKVRYKTGEIGFLDYLLNIKSMKADAAKHINYNKRWLNTLKRLGEYRKMHGSLMKKPIEAITGGHAPIPNGTLILTQPDVTMLTNQTGIDLSKVENAMRLARSLYLIGIVIVDGSAGTMRVLFPDSSSDWDVHSLAAIDAEVAKTDNSKLMKELNRMVNN